QDFVGRAGDARGALELVRQKFPQRTVAERSALEAIGRKRRTFALEHRGRGRNETIDWNVVGIVVAAGEIVFGKPCPLGRRRRQRGCQQGREVERFGGHAVSFFNSSHRGRASRYAVASAGAGEASS